MTAQLTLDDAMEARDKAIARVSRNAEEHAPRFHGRASHFILEYLAMHGPTSGEELTIACRNAQIIPHDDRAFGAVYKVLSNAGKIEKAGQCLRKRGHGTAGGNIWRLAKDGHR
jgi:hypothetical protein